MKYFIFLFLSFPAFAYEGLGVDTETLKKFAPPPLAPEASRRIQKYMDVRAPGLGMLSPDGKKMFFTWKVTGTTQIWRADGPNTFPIQMTGGEDSTLISDITPDGKTLIINRDIGGQENPGLYLMSADGGPLEAIFVKPKVQAFFQHVSDNGRFIYISANDVKPDSYAIYRYDMKTKNMDRIFNEPGIWYLQDSWKDECFLFQRETGSLTSEFYEWCDKDKKLIPILGQNEKMEYVVRYAPTRNEYFVLTPKFGEFRRLYLFKNGNFKSITPDMKSDVESFTLDYKRERLLYEVNDRGYSRLSGLNAKTLKPIKIPDFGSAEQIYVGSTTKNGRYTSFGVETAKAPRTNYVYDWTTGKLNQWVRASAPELDTKNFSPNELTSYPARDGTSIPMFVLKPKQCESKLCPVIVHFHGGPESQTRPYFSGTWQLLAEEGFIVVQPNVRGSDGYGKTWLASDDGAKRLNIISDIEDAAKEIRKKYSVGGQAPKVGVMGWSYGGYTTLLAMTRFAGSFDAGVAMVGMSNLVTFLKNTAPYRRILRISEYGDPEKDEKILKELSPETYIDKLKSPLLIIQGANDPRVPAGEAVQMYEKIKRKGIPTGLIIFADEGHGASSRSNKVLEIGHTFEFFKKYLSAEKLP